LYEEDRALVDRLLAGDERAFREFFDMHAQRLAAFVMRRTGADPAVAEDVVQNAMIRAVRGLHNYRGEASLHTWLCTICRSEIVDRRRKEGRQPRLISMDGDEAVGGTVAQMHAASEFDFGPTVGEPDRAELVAATLSRLPQRYVSILELKYGDGSSVEEIARSLGLTPTAAQSLLARAREAFRDAWDALHHGR
jgi:RNA polymerase sigma-70 factor (ECF subfamily)